MPACTFFGHKDSYYLDQGRLLAAIREQILLGMDTFYVGNQGRFDSAVYGCLKELRKEYPYIRIGVVLAYLPTKKEEMIVDSMYPEIEGHPKFAIEQRNRWMIDKAERCICYINHTWGGAYKFVKLAKKRGLTIIKIGNAEI